MEVAPGIHRIEAPLGDRFVAMHLLIGDECALLFDTGMDRTPYDYMLPYLDQIGVPAETLVVVIWPSTGLTTDVLGILLELLKLPKSSVTSALWLCAGSALPVKLAPWPWLRFWLASLRPCSLVSDENRTNRFAGVGSCRRLLAAKSAAALAPRARPLRPDPPADRPGRLSDRRTSGREHCVQGLG